VPEARQFHNPSLDKAVITGIKILLILSEQFFGMHAGTFGFTGGSHLHAHVFPLSLPSSVMKGTIPGKRQNAPFRQYIHFHKRYFLSFIGSI
jgi:hypothetical protein